MDNTALHALEHLFLTLGDKTRLRLLSLMAAGPVSVGHLVDSLGESQPKVSRHLAYMRQNGIVTTQRDGKWIYYMLSQPTDPKVAQMLDSVISILTGGMPTTQAELASPSQPVAAKRHLVQEPVNEPMLGDTDEYYDQPDGDYEASGRQELEVFLL